MPGPSTDGGPQRVRTLREGDALRHTNRALRSQRSAPALQLEFERNEQAPGAARAATARVCQNAGVDEFSRFTVVLLVSEIVTNAVLHSRAPSHLPISLAVTVGEEAVRVTVADCGEGFTPTPRDPTLRQEGSRARGSREYGGYGLYLLEKSSTRWGVNTLGGTRVWFEVGLPR